jgi:hypothetical protein
LASHPLAEWGIARFVFRGPKVGEEALIWECHLLSNSEDVPDHPDWIAHWLEAAHETTGEWFDDQIEGELKEPYR